MRVHLAVALFLVAGGAGSMITHADAQTDAGKAVFVRWCAGCHEPMPGHGFDPPAGTYRLQQKYNGSRPAALEERKDLTGPTIKALVRNGINMMPRSRKTEISDQDLDALVAYLTRLN